MISYENYMRMHGLHGLGTVAARQMAQAKDELVQKHRAEMRSVFQTSNDFPRSGAPIPSGEPQTPVGLDWTNPQRRTLDQAQYSANPPADIVTSGLQGFRGRRRGRSRGAGQVVQAGDRVCLALRVPQRQSAFRDLVDEVGGTIAGQQGDVFLLEVQVHKEYTQSALVETARQVAEEIQTRLETAVEYVNIEAGTCGAGPADSSGGGGSTNSDSGGETTSQPSNGGGANGDQAAFGGCGWLCPIVGLSAFAGGLLLLRFAST